MRRDSSQHNARKPSAKRISKFCRSRACCDGRCVRGRCDSPLPTRHPPYLRQLEEAMARLTERHDVQATTLNQTLTSVRQEGIRDAQKHSQAIRTKWREQHRSTIPDEIIRWIDAVSTMDDGNASLQTRLFTAYNLRCPLRSMCENSNLFVTAVLCAPLSRLELTGCVRHCWIAEDGTR